MSGLIVLDQGGGDACFKLVDNERWAQILEVHAAYDESLGMDKLQDIILFMSTEPEKEDAPPPPKGAPAILRGNIINTWYTQTFVHEPVEISNVTGIITLPGG